MDIVFRFQDKEFEWNDRKAHVNLTKHDIAFEEAAEVFFDPFRREGDASVDDEQREFVLGYSLSNRLLLVVHVERGNRIRIISAHSATRSERTEYEEK